MSHSMAGAQTDEVGGHDGSAADVPVQRRSPEPRTVTPPGSGDGDLPLRERPWGQQLGVVAVVFAGVGTLAGVLSRASLRWDTDSFTLWCAFAALGGIAVLDLVPWWVPASSRVSSASLPTTGTFVDIADLFFVTAVLLLGPVGAVTVSLPSFVIDQLHAPTRIYKQVYNIGAYVVQGAAAWAVFHRLLIALGVGAGDLTRPGWLVAAIAAAATFELLNVAACSFARWVMHGFATPLNELLRLYPVWTETSAVVIGVIVAALWLAGHWLVLLAVFPVLIVRQGLYLRDLQLASRSDPKTGLANFSHFTEVVDREVRRALRQDSPLAVLVTDLDHLRELNTRHGHLAGDVVLVGIADILRASVREWDLVCRFGGEEFLVLLPATTEDEALATAERLRSLVEQQAFDAPTATQPLHATMSVGVASLHRNGTTAGELLHAADLAVYQAKAAGRNRVAVAP